MLDRSQIGYQWISIGRKFPRPRERLALRTGVSGPVFVEQEADHLLACVIEHLRVMLGGAQGRTSFLEYSAQLQPAQFDCRLLAPMLIRRASGPGEDKSLVLKCSKRTELRKGLARTVLADVLDAIESPVSMAAPVERIDGLALTGSHDEDSSGSGSTSRLSSNHSAP